MKLIIVYLSAMVGLAFALPAPLGEDMNLQERQDNGGDDEGDDGGYTNPCEFYVSIIGFTLAEKFG